MVVIAAPMYNIIIIITRSYGVHIIIVAIGVLAVVVLAGGAFLLDLLLIPNTTPPCRAIIGQFFYLRRFSDRTIALLYYN